MLSRMLSKQGSEVSSFFLNESIFAVIYSIIEWLQYCNNHKSPLGNNRET